MCGCVGMGVGMGMGVRVGGCTHTHITKHAKSEIVSGSGTHAYINMFVLEMCGSVSKHFPHEVLLLCSIPSMLCWR